MRNRKIIVLLSGEISCGKSSLCENLQKKFDFKILKSKEALYSIAQEQHRRLKEGRWPLMKIGEHLDKETNGSWLRDFFQKDIIDSERVIIDAVRIEQQIDAFRQAYSQSVVHIHLKASPEELKRRFLKRREVEDTEENLLKLYAEFKNDKTEKQVHSLEKKADLVIDTERSKEDDVLIRGAGFLKILSPIDAQLVDVLVGGQFGSEGKGQVVAYLAPDYDCIVRVGGPNAGHKVYAEPKPHVFHILPSGTVKSPKSKLILGPGAVISKEILLDEISKFGIDDPERLIIDPNVTIITEEDRAYEKKHDKIGSTAQGVGKATADNILKRIAEFDGHKAKFCPELKQYIGSSHEALEKLFSQDKKILLEGTQGTHLSIHHGLYPHVTSRDTTVSGCLAEAGISPRKVRKVIMVTRTYPIRVQDPDNGTTSGSFVSDELKMEEISKRSGIPLEELLETETTSTTGRKRRIAEFSCSLFRKACELNSPTDIALTFADYIKVANRTARRFDQLTPETIQFIEEIERCSGVQVSLIATRFSYRSIIDRRNGDNKMELETFFKKVPYLYHLTDRRNIGFIKDQKCLYSTVELVKMSESELDKSFLKSKRPDIVQIKVAGFSVFIRDQKPLTNALERSLNDGFTSGSWIYHLNKRVFTWPNLKRLRAHYAAYETTNPVIIRLSTKEVFDLNNHPELCRINSGDSRCIAHYGGNPMPRGKDTFQKIKDYSFDEVAEVTFSTVCKLPNFIEVGNSPDGEWKRTNLK